MLIGNPIIREANYLNEVLIQVLVIGAGPIGLLAAQCAKALGMTIFQKHQNNSPTKNSWY